MATLPDLPPGPWRAAAPMRAGALAEARAFEPRRLFANDFLSYCKLFGIVPHPHCC